MAPPAGATTAADSARVPPPSAARPAILLYDWDNTLVDAWAPIAGALNQVLAARDLPLWTIRQTRERVRTNDEDSWRAWFADDWKAARKDFARAMRTQDLSQIRLMPGADEALEAGSPIPQAGVSNKGRPFVEAEAAAARKSIQASAGDLANQVVQAVLPLAVGGSR